MRKTVLHRNNIYCLLVIKMKVGFEWNCSKEKRALDVALASLLWPGQGCVKLVIRRLIMRSSGLQLAAVFEQKRIGRGHEPFDIQKFQTINPLTGLPFGFWAEIMRRMGVDETAQLGNVWQGSMSITGHRPLVPEEFDEVRSNLPPRLGEAWEKVTFDCRPGIISSYGLDHHIRPEADANEYERRAEQDVRDARDASLYHDIQLVAAFAGAAITRRLA